MPMKVQSESMIQERYTRIPEEDGTQGTPAAVAAYILAHSLI